MTTQAAPCWTQLVGVREHLDETPVSADREDGSGFAPAASSAGLSLMRGVVRA
jgi:hypothetical protein